LTGKSFTEVYKEMEELLSDSKSPPRPPVGKSDTDCWTGRCKAIGISNFSIKTTTELLESGTKVFPCLNQVEIHPYYPNDALIEWSKSKGIHCQAYRLVVHPSLR